MTNTDVYRRFVDEIVVGKKLELIDELFHPDCVLPIQKNLDGLKAQMAQQAQAYNVSVKYLHGLADGDWVISHMALTIELADGSKTAHIEEIECAHVVDEKIAEMWGVADVASAFLQLGLPVPGHS